MSACVHVVFSLTENRSNRHDFPTPESPISNNLKR